MKRLLILAFVALSVLSCNNSAPLLPSSSGKAGEVIVVLSKENWDGLLGEHVRETLGDECPWLAMKEPLYTLASVPNGAFGDLFKAHRNIVFFHINPQISAPGVKIHRDKWAAPQIVIQISGVDDAQADSVYMANSDFILNAIEQAERDRVVASTRRYEKKGIFNKVAEVFGGSPHFPSGYKLRKISADFAWISDDKQYTTQGIFVYRYPVSGEGDLTMEAILDKRAEFLQTNVPGMFEGTYMTTADFFPPLFRYVKYSGRHFAELHGQWEVKGDFMGGPFCSHSFYSPDGQWVVCVEAWVYAPRFDKRQYFRQVESILYTWDWNEK